MADEGAEMAARSALVDRLLQQKNYVEALNTCLLSVPGNGKSEEIRVSNLFRRNSGNF